MEIITIHDCSLPFRIHSIVPPTFKLYPLIAAPWASAVPGTVDDLQRGIKLIASCDNLAQEIGSRARSVQL